MDVMKALEGAVNSSDPLQHLVGVNYFKEHPVLTICYLVVMVCSTFIGIFGNIMVIGAVFVYPKLRTKPNIFIVNLACADFFVGAFVQGFSIVALVEGYGFFQDKPVLCHAIATICLVSCSCSMWNIAAIAFNRFICLCYNHLYPKIYSWKKSLLIALCLWIICVLLEIPNYFSWGGHTFDPKTMACSYDRTANYTYTLFFVLVAIAPPLLLVCVCYLRIFLHVRNSALALKKIAGDAAKNTQNTGWNSQELKLAKTLFIVFVTFLIFWAPYAVVVLVDVHDDWPKVVYVVVIQLAHTNSSANSIIYAATNKDFREGYKRFVCCWQCRGKKESLSAKRDNMAKYLATQHHISHVNGKANRDCSDASNDTKSSELPAEDKQGRKAQTPERA